MEIDSMIRATKRLSRVEVPQESDGIALKVAWIRISRGKSGTYFHRYCLHSHTYFEMHLTLHGWQEYQFDNAETMMVPEGELVLIAPEHLHRCKRDADDICKLSMSFRIGDMGAGDSIESAYLQKCLYFQPYYKLPVTSRMRSIIENLCVEANEMQHGFRTMVRMSFIQILFELARGIEKAYGLQNFEEIKAEKAASDSRVEYARRIIQENISTGITREEVAAHMFMSAKQLDRIVRADTGMSVADMIKNIKHQAACEMLLETEMTLQEVSDALGYANVYNFIRFFKGNEGMSPGRFRHARHFEMPEISKE